MSIDESIEEHEYNCAVNDDYEHFRPEIRKINYVFFMPEQVEPFYVIKMRGEIVSTSN